jgi:hypothetical protein
MLLHHLLQGYEARQGTKKLHAVTRIEQSHMHLGVYVIFA